MDRADVENALLKIGVPSGIKGFKYITDAVMFMECNDIQSMTKELYPMVAEKNKTTVSRVERAIRHAFEAARSTRGNHEETEKYIGFANCENKNSLKMLHMRIRQECSKSDNADSFCESDKLTDSKIRQIIREELKAVLGGIV